MNILKSICITALVIFSCSAKAISIENIDLPLGLSAQVYVPDNDKPQAQKLFPTLYIMDGQHFLYSAIGYQKSLNWRNQSSPEFIIVAINTDAIGDGSEQRRTLLGKDSSKLIDVIENSLIPQINTKYPASNLNLYAGWEHAAGFGLDLFTSRLTLFAGYLLASSPTFTAERLSKVESTLAKEKAKKSVRFYLALGEHEDYATESFKRLASFYNTSEASANLALNVSKALDHFNTPINLFTNGLQWMFRDYPELTFDSLEHLKTFGGVKAIKKYYENRASRYHTTNKVGENTKFTAARHAIEGDDWALYRELETAFGPVETGAGAWWNYFFGKFHTKNGDYSRAIALFNKGLAANPEAHQLWAALADAQWHVQLPAEALQSIEQAVNLVSTDAPEYKLYMQKIADMKQLTKGN